MKKYDSYKESGVEWIGEIPKHWYVKRLKNIGSLYSGLSGKSGSDFEKVPTENFKPFINFTNIANNKYIVGDNFGFVKIDENENQNQVKKNDLFFLMSSENQEDVGKSALLLNDYDELYLNSFCKGFRLTINSDARFINYLLTSSALSQLISLEGRGFTRINLRMEGVENLPIILPQSIEEQTVIANYLDHKTTQIDHLIAKKEQFIKLLEEERIAVINQAVTKGLDPSVPMKDSGIEWLGEIPAHWEVSSIKFHAKIQNGSTPSSSNEEFWNGDVNWVTTDDLGKLEDKNIYKTRRTITKLGYESCGTTLAPIDSIVISTRAPIGHIGILKIEASTNQGCKTIIPISINPLFCFYYFLNSKEILQSMGQGSTFKELPTSSLKDFKIVFPKSIEEQQEISKFLEFKNDEIDKIKSKSNQEIELLKEYKTALISDVVTGKLDVRNEKLN